MVATAAKSATKLNRLPPLPTVRDLIQLYRLRALRQLSQNFLLDQRLTNKIARAMGNVRDGEVCEVGPGPGNITRSILNRNPARVVVIEKDRRFLPALEMLADAAPCPLDIITGDVLSFNMERTFNEANRKAWSEQPPNIHIVGNLPFSVATPLIIKWLHAIAERKNAWTNGRVQLTLTFQKEVAERMVASVMQAQRCRLSIMCQNWCHVEHKFTIPGKAFVPKPEVDVGVVHLTPLLMPVIDLPFKLVEKVTRCLFCYRQKYSIKGIETLFPTGRREELAPELYHIACLDPTTRPFQLTVPEVGRLCHAYRAVLQKEPSLAKYNQRASAGSVNIELESGDTVETSIELESGGDTMAQETDHEIHLY